jgi:hypothetical protein
MGGGEMSDTPRTDEQINGKPCTRFEILAGDSLRNASVQSEFARGLERELNRACEMYRKLDIHALNLVDRIRRLEEALTEIELAMKQPASNHRLMQIAGPARQVINIIKKAKEAKP